MEQRRCETSFSSQFLISIPLASGVKKQRNVLGENKLFILFFSLSNVIILSFEINIYCVGFIYGLKSISMLLHPFIKLSRKGLSSF